MPKAKITIVQHRVPDDCPDSSYLEQEGWEDRRKAYNDGDFHFVGVRAKASIKIPHGAGWIETAIESPGLWGIESDSGEDYFQEVFEEEKHTLLEMLESLREYEIIE